MFFKNTPFGVFGVKVHLDFGRQVDKPSTPIEFSVKLMNRGSVCRGKLLRDIMSHREGNASFLMLLTAKL